MQSKKIDFMNDPGALSKFCAKNDKVFGCKEAFGCQLTCPIAMAVEVQYLVNEKGMTIGEAHRACLRKEIPEPQAYKIIGEAIRASYDGRKKEYPNASKP
jgi:hypothetical protein